MSRLSPDRNHARWAAVVAAAGITLASLYAQNSAPATPGFEAASIKRNTSGTDNTARNTGAGGRLVFENFTVRELIMAAYDVFSFQVLGGPNWTMRDRFDVQAAAATAAPMPELNRMLRALLAERFALRVRVEQRDLPRFTLTRARRDGRVGPGLKASAVDCGPSGRGRRTPDTPPGPIVGCSAWISPASIAFQGQSMSALTDVLGRLLERPVIDQTGLTGGYDFELKFAPEARQRPAVDSRAGSVFAALQEQLGLKLESGRGEVDVIMIESVEPPTPN
jgi:uncharacterized protein (TIGR03435 family)